MEDFEEVKSRLRRVNVTAADYGNAHGVLSLDGENSSIELTGNLPFGNAPPPGWFDLRLQEANGRTIFVHNAIRTSMSFPSGSETRSAVLFPNMIVDNADALDADNRLRSISFGLDGWNACFAYNYIETLNVFGSPSESLRTALDSARYDFFREEPLSPDEVYVVNDLGKLVNFEANGLQYSIYAGRRTRHGRNRLNIEVKLVGTIDFPEAVDLETATDACWDWRRYFNQMAMATLPFTGMTVAATTEPSSQRGNLYLPNERGPIVGRKETRTDPHHMPMNQWHEREAAGEAMRRWLTHQEERRVFRAALDRVLARPGHVAIEDAVALCGGVDSLAELSIRGTLPREALDKMTEAAIAAAVASGLSLEPGRVRGVLGSLQSENLRQRLRRLAEIAAPEADSELVGQWIEVLLPLRLFGAHGRAPATDHDLIAGPAVQALAALCARYDLQQAGVPNRGANDARSQPCLQWDEALMALQICQ